MPKKFDKDKAILMVAFAKIDPVALAVALGCVWGLILFLATAILLMKGAPPGGEAGPHLSLLGLYLPGYEVDSPGAFLGAAYLCVIGAAVGYVLAVLWNFTHHLYVTLIVLRAMWWKMMAE